MNEHPTKCFMKKYVYKYLFDYSAIILIFIIALSIRISYQHNSIINSPIRDDAARYFFVAYNLYNYHVYSPDKSPAPKIPPQEDLSKHTPPGYPFFLYPFIASSYRVEDFLERVTTAQAILGSLTAVIAYILARICFTAIPWALIPGLLTALSPHLIACDHYLITEPLFTFTIAFGILILIISWQKNKPLLSFVSGIFFGYAVLIRSMSLLLCLFMGTVYLFNPKKWSFAPKKTISIHILCLLIGWAATYTPYPIYKSIKERGQTLISDYENFEIQLLPKNQIITNQGLTPPAKNLVIAGYDISGAIKGGADINLEQWIKKHKDESYKFSTVKLKERFRSDPMAYIKWYLGGKILFMWHWDNMYNGDVYQYYMFQKGFDTVPFLHAIHTAMHALHWPLYVLTLISPLILLISKFRKKLNPKSIILLPHILIFIYFAALLTILIPLPRYAIPLRPFSYILATASLVWIIKKRKGSNLD